MACLEQDEAAAAVTGQHHVAVQEAEAAGEQVAEALAVVRDMVVSVRQKDGAATVLPSVKDTLEGETRVWRKKLGSLSKASD